jgi:hypothetical protein
MKTGYNWGSSVPVVGPITGIIGATIGAGIGGVPAAIGAMNSASASTAAPNVTKVDANVTVKAETADPKGLAEQILEVINRMIAQGHLHNQGEAQSAASSPFISAYGMP